MSRVAKNPVIVPGGVEVTLDRGEISVKGTLGTLVVIVLWIFYSANILLISAVCVSALQDRWDEKAEGPGSGGRSQGSGPTPDP